MWLLAQTLSPSDAQTWTAVIKDAGVVGILALLVVAILRQWVVPWYVVTMMERRIGQLEAREEKLLDLALKGSSLSQTAVSALKERG